MRPNLHPPRLHAQTIPALLLAAALAGLLPAAAQQPPAAPPPPAEPETAEEVFGERIEVNVINVDVYVTDKDGNAITGLTKGDFELYENKAPMTITNFFAVEGGRMRTEEGFVEAVREDPRALLEAAPIPEDQRLRLILYIDNFNIRPFNRNRVLREVRQFLDRFVGPEDRVMLVSYDRTLKIRQPFTSDARVISGSLAELERVSAFAVNADSERAQALDDIDDSSEVEEAISRARSYAESVMNDLSFSINALKDMTSSLAGMPGRKAVLYVSDGLPMIAGEDVFHYIDNKFKRARALNEAFSYDASRRFDELVSIANSNRITFYTIDAGGLRTDAHMAADQRGGPGRGSFLDTVNTHNLQSPLYYLAENTGGQAIINRNRVLPALEKVNQDFRNYYSLGYSPAHSGDGRMYKVEVKVKNRDYKIRFRETYRDKTIATRMSDGTRAALNFDITSNPMDMQLEFGRAVPRSQDSYFQVPVVVKIPLDKVVLIPRAGRHVARLRLYVAAMDNEGGASEVQEVPVVLDIPDEEVELARQQLYAYTVELIMRGGSQRVAVGLRDEFGATSDNSFISRALYVGKG